MVIPATDVWRQDDRGVRQPSSGGEIVQNHLGPQRVGRRIGIQTNARHLEDINEFPSSNNARGRAIIAPGMHVVNVLRGIAEHARGEQGTATARCGRKVAGRPWIE